MRATSISIIAASLAVTGCDSSPPTQPNQPIVVRSEAQDQLHKLDDDMRHIALKRAILDSGMTCQRVTASAYAREHRNLSMWTAHCDDGTDWGIFVGPDGSAQVRRCVDLVELGLPACPAGQPSPKAELPTGRSGG